MALAIYHESRGEVEQGRIAVGFTVINRVESGRYGATPCAVVFQPRQYAPSRLPADRLQPKEGDAWEEAMRVSFLVITKQVDDPVNGATDFLTPEECEWASWFDHKRHKRIGDHVFFKPIRKDQR